MIHKIIDFYLFINKSFNIHHLQHIKYTVKNEILTFPKLVYYKKIYISKKIYFTVIYYNSD